MKPSLMARVGWPLLTVAIVAFLVALSSSGHRIPYLPVLLLPAVILITAMGGIFAGIASAAISVLYYAYYFSDPGTFGHFSGDSVPRMVTLGIFTPVLVALVGVIRWRLSRALQSYRTQMRALGDRAPILIAYFDADQICRYANHRYAELFGFTPERIIGTHIRDFIDTASYEQFSGQVERVFAGTPSSYSRTVEVEGNSRHFQVSLIPDVSASGAIQGFYAMSHEVTEQRVAEADALKAKERLALALDGSGLALWDLDIESSRVYLSESWQEMLGNAPAVTHTTLKDLFDIVPAPERPLLYQAWLEVIKGQREVYDVEHRVLTQKGEWRWIESRGRVVQRAPDGRAIRMAGTNADITDRKRSEQRIQHLATHDALTDLPNRFLFDDRLRQAIARAERDSHRLTVMFIDLDRFKTVNDSLGHLTGDRLLCAVSQRLRTALRSEDTLARPGGDEFILLVPSVKEEVDPAVVARRLVDALTRPFHVDERQLHVTASIGVAVYPSDGRDVTTLLKNADSAMYQAKEAGRNKIKFFHASMTEQAITVLDMENRLRRAIQLGELDVHYQPQIDLPTGRVIGAEALVRWRDPVNGWIPPGKFISVAEESGLIVPIGEWVLTRACLQAKSWQDKGLENFSIAVNVSARQFHEPEFTEMVCRILDQSGLAPSSLELEITESVIMRNAEETITLLQGLNDIGIRLAIDDFGTGYSSLNYLKRFPIHRLKVDQTFVRDIADDPNDAVIVSAMIAMSHSLGLRVIAEGVETATQAEFLRQQGCDEVQGYYFARPLPPEECEFSPQYSAVK